MAAPVTSEGTAAPGSQQGLPQMDVNTFPSQIFWLAVTFSLLFIVLWKVTLPKISGAITDRRTRIDGDLATADDAQKAASDALKGYEAHLVQAKARALTLADENRKKITAELDGIKQAADKDAKATMSAAEARIAAERAKAGTSVVQSAAEAAAAIVSRLIGVEVSVQEAANTVGAVAPKRS
jgi:F-type H+-transporting ATPase subunit b